MGWDRRAHVTDLCSSPRGPPAPHRRSPGSPPPALGAQPAQGEVEGAAGEEEQSPGLSAGCQACEHNSDTNVGKLFTRNLPFIYTFNFLVFYGVF